STVADRGRGTSPDLDSFAWLTRRRASFDHAEGVPRRRDSRPCPHRARTWALKQAAIFLPPTGPVPWHRSCSRPAPPGGTYAEVHEHAHCSSLDRFLPRSLD